LLARPAIALAIIRRESTVPLRLTIPTSADYSDFELTIPTSSFRDPHRRARALGHYYAVATRPMRGRGIFGLVGYRIVWAVAIGRLVGKG
jgi:hypothetical protein